MSKRIDLETTKSQHGGLKGIFESGLRKFKALFHLCSMIPVYFVAALTLATALWPSVSFFRFLSKQVSMSPWWLQNAAYAFAIAAGFFMYGFTLLFVAPALNFIIRGNLKAWRGPYYSAESFKWFLHNGLTYLMRFTFLEFITPSPLSLLFYKMMGMKIGRGTIINSTWISDPSLIEMGEKVTIGGSVTIVAHYGQGGLLVIAPVKIGDACTIGIKATIMGGAQIGAGAKIMPHSVVMPKTIVPAGETWGGVPAKKIESAASSVNAA
jgi:hypothetical protein